MWSLLLSAIHARSEVTVIMNGFCMDEAMLNYFCMRLSHTGSACMEPWEVQVQQHRFGPQQRSTQLSHCATNLRTDSSSYCIYALSPVDIKTNHTCTPLILQSCCEIILYSGSKAHNDIACSTGTYISKTCDGALVTLCLKDFTDIHRSCKFCSRI